MRSLCYHLVIEMRSGNNACNPSIFSIEKISLPDNPGIPVDYEHLLNLEELGDDSFVPSGIKKRYGVKQLLDGIELPKELRFQQALDITELINVNVNVETHNVNQQS